MAGPAPTGEIHLSNIRVVGGYPASGSDGFNVCAGLLTIADCTSENAPGADFFFTGAGMLRASNLTVVNASESNSAHNAFWFGGTGFSNVSDLSLSDTQSSPTGYVIGGTGVGIIDGVIAHFANVPLASLDMLETHVK
jgi:hypothetical protein